MIKFIYKIFKKDFDALMAESLKAEKEKYYKALLAMQNLVKFKDEVIELMLKDRKFF